MSDPGYQDEVKNILNDTTGTVIAAYAINGEIYFDVRSDDEIHYQTPAKNWETTVAYEE